MRLVNQWANWVRFTCHVFVRIFTLLHYIVAFEPLFITLVDRRILCRCFTIYHAARETIQIKVSYDVISYV